MPLEWPTRIGRGTYCVRIWDTFERWTQAVNKRVKKQGFLGPQGGRGTRAGKGGQAWATVDPIPQRIIRIIIDRIKMIAVPHNTY